MGAGYQGDIHAGAGFRPTGYAATPTPGRLSAILKRAY